MRLLLTGAYAYSNEQIDCLEKLGFDILFVSDERKPLSIDVSEIEAVVCNSLFMHTPIDRFESLKVIQLTSAGLDRVPIEYIKNHGIKIFNAKGVYSAPIAEFVICGVLQLMKQSRFFYNNQKNRVWEKHRGLTEISDKTVCVIGTGSVGSEIAKRFKAFGTNVIGVNLSQCSNDVFDEIYSVNLLNEVLPISDIIVLALPLKENNLNFFDKEMFSLMKSSSVFVNIARGKLVNQEDLICALKTKQISSAVLDVFDEEPLNDKSPLWDMDNVILTPHNSFVGEQNSNRLFAVVKDNLERFVNG